MKPEIGGEFWHIEKSGDNFFFPKKTHWFISGRSALKAIIRENDFKVVAVPDWCCDSIIKPFADAGIKVIFYPALSENCNIPKEADCAFVMDFFGYTGHSDTSSFDGSIIRDLTHSLFSAEYTDADYYFGSLRKWAGFATGGFAWGFKNPVSYEKDSTEFISIREKSMEDKKCYIEGNTNCTEFLEALGGAEMILEDIGVHRASQKDIDSAHLLDISYIRTQRRKNARVLLDSLSEYAIFPTLKDTDCPMFVPIRVKKRNELKLFLAERGIGCPAHWPLTAFHNGILENAKSIYNEELSLVCDQRYDENDMHRIVDAVKTFMTK